MRCIRPLWLVVLLLISDKPSFAQYAPQWNNLLINPTAYHPTAEFKTSNISVYAHSRFQWTGLEGAPTTHLIQAFAPITPEDIAGLSILYDRIGPQTWFGGSIDYSRIVFQDGQTTIVRIGGSLSLNQFNLDACSLIGPSDENPCSGNDPLLPTQNTKSSAGIYISLSASAILSNLAVSGTLYKFPIASPNINGIPFNSPFQGIFTAAYLFNDLGSVQWRPNLTLKLGTAAWQLELGVYATINQTFHAGILYRGPTKNTLESLSLLVGWNINESITIGYAYELSINALSFANSGTHDIVLKILLPRPWAFPQLRTIYSPRFM
ncbi:MAG: type IX secretion system membrane protein PorP/SprF [Chlorobi bacterium]|nr:type IX secretion system membrane protein PorP/SprF [Chlorobiota bacterium]